MRKILSLLSLLASPLLLVAQSRTVTGPDGNLAVTVQSINGTPSWSVTLDGIPFLENSPIGLVTDIADLSSGLELKETAEFPRCEDYSIPFIKNSSVHYKANDAIFYFSKGDRQALAIEFLLSANDIAFRYIVFSPSPDTKVCRVLRESTGFVFPAGTTSFLCPQMPPMAGFARTTPSYETPYTPDAELGKNGDGYGYTFPCLFRNSDKGWVLISETGVSGNYCGSRLEGNSDGSYRIAYPMEEEFNGNGTSTPGISLTGEFHGHNGAGFTPWRTLTAGRDLAPIAETTIPWDVVEPRYKASKEYSGSKGSWSWIMKMDDSITFEGQKEYIDLSAAMGWQTVLVDNWWDTKIGRRKVEELASYAASKGVQLMLWYNSNGYWNDAPQGPRDIMHNPISRRREMAWLRSIGAKGIKVDFFGSDKQVTMQLYEDILTDANEFGLMVVFHGCTLPRGWERMYPNFASAEAVLASENLHFFQERCDTEALQACMHPFTRNAVAVMDFGGSALNKVYNATNDPSLPGTVRRTSEVFALATAVLFQSPIQHFALAPNNLYDAPAWALDFMKNVPTTWDEVRLIDGYPGRYVIMARRHGERWYIAGINAGEETLKMKIALPMLQEGEITVYSDGTGLIGSKQTRKLRGGSLKVEIPCNGGLLIVQ